MLLGHRPKMVVTLQNHSGIATVLEVSRGGAVTHIVQIVQQGAVRRHHKVFMSPARRREAPAKVLFQVIRGILALRATFRLDSPVKNPHTNPFQTPSELGHPSYPSSRRLRTTFPSHQMPRNNVP